MHPVVPHNLCKVIGKIKYQESIVFIQTFDSVSVGNICEMMSCSNTDKLLSRSTTILQCIILN